MNLPEEIKTPEPAPAPAVREGSDDNLMAALSYISIVSVVMLIVKKDSDYVQFHAKQGVVLFAGEIVLWILQIISLSLFFLWGLIWLVFVIVSIIGFIKALSGERYRLPLVADIADKINI